MPADLLVVPVKRGLPAEPGGLLHVPQGLFDVPGIAAGPHHLRRVPIRGVCEQEGFAQCRWPPARQG